MLFKRIREIGDSVARHYSEFLDAKWNLKDSINKLERRLDNQTVHILRKDPVYRNGYHSFGEDVTLEDAVRMIIEHLGLEYVDAKTEAAKLEGKKL